MPPLAVDDFETALKLLVPVAGRPPGHVAPFLQAQQLRCRGLVAAARHDGGNAEDDLRNAVDRFRNLGYPFWLARTLLDLGTWSTNQGRPQDAEAMVAEAMQLFVPLAARPWVQQANCASTAPVPARANA
jgi:hypothetical protein